MSQNIEKNETINQDNNLKVSNEEIIEKLISEGVELKDKLLRLAADFDNYKKRSEKDKKEFQKYAIEQLLVDLIPVLDNLDHVTSIRGNSRDPFIDGVRMITKQFDDILVRHQARRESYMNCDFDPAKQEAVEYRELEGVESGKVVKEYQKSFWLSGKLVRPSRVVVSK